MIDVYLYASCTSCRKTDQYLRESGIDYATRDFFRDRFTRKQLVNVLSHAGLAPRDILSRRSRVYQARSAEIDALEDDALLDLMLEEPTLLRRPLVVGPAGSIVGHNADSLDRMIEASRA